MADVVVYLGPSLPRDVAARLLPSADLRPPVRLGDVCAAVYEGVDVIVVIDGYFEQVPAVWHKEILWALDRGAWVFGGASMGALRAAELAHFGMRGVGQIFERFASGEYTDDDEVAIVHAPADDDFVPLSVAMASIRSTLERAVIAGVITPPAAAALVADAKAQHYPERSWAALAAGARAAGIDDAEISRLRAYVRDVAVDQKVLDAAAVLSAASSALAAGFTRSTPTFVFEQTANFEKLQAIVRAERAASAIEQRYGRSVEDVRAGLGDSSLPLLHLLVDREAARLGLRPAAESFDARLVADVAAARDVPGPVAAEMLRLTSLAHQLEEHEVTDLTTYVEVALGGRPSVPGDLSRVEHLAAHGNRAVDGRVVR